MSFNESNTVEQMIIAAAIGNPHPGLLPAGEEGASREMPPGWGVSLDGDMAGAAARWEYAPAADVPRQPGDVMVEPWLRLALIRLNPEIANQPGRADEERPLPFVLPGC